MAQHHPGREGTLPGPSDLDRRQFVRLSLSLVLPVLGLTAGSVAGCTVDDPRIEAPHNSTGASPPNGTSGPTAPSPTPTFAGATEAADTERRLAGLAGAILSGPWRSRLGERKPLIAGVRTAHLVHAAAFGGPQPTARPTEPSPEPLAPGNQAKSLDAAVTRLIRAEVSAAARHRAAALATTGYATLLWGSVSVAATAYASALTSASPVPVRSLRTSQPMPQLSDVEAMQQLVRQLHAIIYGYQLAIGQLSEANTRRRSALVRLGDLRVLLDELTTTLLSRSASVPSAEPAYVPSVTPRSDATALALIVAMEVALAPFCGLWLAAAAINRDRSRAFRTLAATVTSGRRFGAPVSAWPGFVS